MTGEKRRIIKTAVVRPEPHYCWADYAKPFTVVPDAILHTDRLDPTDKVLIVALFDRLANRKRPTSVSVRSIERDWKLSHNTVKERLMWFEIAGWLVGSDEKSMHGAKKYTLDFPRLAVCLEERGVRPQGRSGASGGTPSASPGTGSASPGTPTNIPSQIPEDREIPSQTRGTDRDGITSSSGTRDGSQQFSWEDPDYKPPSQVAEERRLEAQRAEARARGNFLRYPKKLGKKYRNKMPGFCTIKDCRQELGPGEGWLINFDNGATIYCPAHIGDAEKRFQMTSTQHRLEEAMRKLGL
jgi:hypothetical protein